MRFVFDFVANTCKAALMDFGTPLVPTQLTSCNHPLGNTTASTASHLTSHVAASSNVHAMVRWFGLVLAMTALLGNVPGIAASSPVSAGWGSSCNPTHKMQQKQTSKTMAKGKKPTGDATAANGSQTASETATVQAGHNNTQNTPVEAAKAESKDAVTFTADDKAMLQNQEKVIAANVGAFLVLGEALSMIKSRNLQKITDPNLTFEDYCSLKWGFGQAYAYRLIGAYECVTHLKTAMVPNGVSAFPTNEAQVRPLTNLKPDEQVKVWAAVLKKANGGVVTAAIVQDVVKSVGEKLTTTETTTDDETEVETAVNHKSDAKAAAGKAARRKLVAISKVINQVKKTDLTTLSPQKFREFIDKIEKLLQSKV